MTRTQHIVFDKNERIKSTIKKSEWMNIVSWLTTVNDVKMALCVGCGSGRLIANNQEVFKINRRHSLQEVKDLVEKIRQINAN